MSGGLDFRGYVALAAGVLVLAGATDRGRDVLVAAWSSGGAAHAPAGPRAVPGDAGASAGPSRPALRMPHDLPRAVKAARAVRAKYGVPVSVTLGQATLESGPRLDSGLAEGERNYFGIKCGSTRSPYQAGCKAFGTGEVFGGVAVRIVDGFRTYRSPEASFLDYGRLLASPRYAAAHQHRNDPAAFVAAVAAAGYATAPGYAARVVAVIDRNGYRRYDR